MGLTGWASVGAVLILAGPVTAQGCGEVGNPCKVDGGKYFVAAPEAPTGIVLWLHGHGGSGAKAVKNAGFTRNFRARGLAFVAPDGQPEPFDNGKPLDWGVRDGRVAPRDDIAFLTAVLDDAQTRMGLGQAPVLLAGFSRGASMAWDLACAKPERFTGVAAVAGGFWGPMTTDCAGPINLFHTHGFADRTVPLEGRWGTFHGFKYHQGNIFTGLDVWRRENGCAGAADQSLTEDGPWQKRWTGCDAGSITLQLWPGGHGIPKGWSGRALDWFETLRAASSE
jgi:polyhydroxybutyrate depolymerase